LVSIITATYNHENFIGKCVESVLAQTYPYWEQIIIDDGSTDRTGEIVAQYRDDRIKYVRQSHVGIWRLGETYNKALQYAQGEFIAVLEGDDFWPSYKLERQLPAFERQEVVLSWGRTIITNSEGETITISPKSLKWFRNRPKREILRKLLFQNFISACTAMCRKDALLFVGGFRQPGHAPQADYPTWLELSLVGEFQPVDEILGYWRRHEGQASMSLTLEMTRADSCSIDLFNRMPQELRDSIGLSVKELVINHQQRLAATHFYLGRIALIQGKWQKAREEFREALDRSSSPTKVETLLGLICSYCKVDLEWAAMIMRRPRLK